MTTDTGSAVLDSEQQDKSFTFVADARDGLHHLLLVEKSMIGQPEPMRPVYVMTFETLEALDAGAKWVSDRRDQWQEWGAIGERSCDELVEHLDGLIRAEPMGPIHVGCMVRHEDNGRTIALDELLVGSHGRQFPREIWRRSFRSKGAAQRVADWLLAEADASRALVGFVADRGPEALNRAADAVAVSAGRGRAVERR